MATQVERLLEDSVKNLQDRLKEIDGKYAVKVKNPYPKGRSLYRVRPMHGGISVRVA